MNIRLTAYFIDQCEKKKNSIATSVSAENKKGGNDSSLFPGTRKNKSQRHKMAIMNIMSD